jgi:hypothetical protein
MDLITHRHLGAIVGSLQGYLDAIEYTILSIPTENVSAAVISAFNLHVALEQV